jgi:Na+-driven multidrug efflux pump
MVLFGVVRATGAVIMPLVILTFTLLVIRFPAAAILQGRFGSDAIWWSFPISSAVAAVLAVTYYKFGGWRNARMRAGIGPPAGAPGGVPAVAPVPRGAASAESVTGT